jgi:methyl-accepting chemotaxis protein
MQQTIMSGEPNRIDNLVDFNAKNRLTRIRIMRLVLLVLFVLSGIFTVGSTFFLFAPGSPMALENYLFTVVSLIIFGSLYAFTQPDSSDRRIDVIVYMVVGICLMIICYYAIIWGINGAFGAAFFIIPVVGSVFGLRTKVVIALAVICGFILMGMLITQNILLTNSQSAQTYLVIGTWFIVYTVVCVCVIFFTYQLNSSNRQLQAQAVRLKDLLTVVNATTTSGAKVSRNLASVTNELNVTSQQQAGNSQEQVAAIAQVTTSLEELSETASQIAQNAASVARATGEAVSIATGIKEASQLAEASTRQGTQAVEQTVASVTQVRNRIELLGQRLLNLTEQNRRVGTIIDLIDEIADETHLLALNASIEAAGNVGGEATATGTSQKGARFGVIAQEIKNLSDRSREATEEVRQAISEMQGAVAAAVLVAEEAKKETSASLTRSEIAGAVIGKLSEIVSASVSRAEEILASVALVYQQCDEISLATSQQRSANNQILLTMRSIADISQQTANAVFQLSTSVSQVKYQLDELNHVLEANQTPLELVAA